MNASKRRSTCRGLLLGLALGTPLAAVDDGAYLAHGVVWFDQGGSNADHANAVAAQPDGKILLTGTVRVGATTVAALARLLPGGGLDPAFGAGTGKVSNPCALPFGSSANAVHPLPNGKILLAGTLWGPSSLDFLVWRLLPNGSCDTSFGAAGTRVIPFDLGGNLSDFADAMAVDRLGRIVVVGTVALNGNDLDMGIVRLTPEGALDSSFSGDGRATIEFDLAGFDADQATGVAIDRSGRILVAGHAWDSAGGGYDFAFARIVNNGSLDSSFGTDGRLAVSYDFGGSNDELLYDVAVWPDGEIVATGSIANGPTAVELAVLRIAADGSQVLGLNLGDFGFGTPAVASSLVLQPDGKILIAGSGPGVSSTDFGIGRLLRDGSPDVSFALGTGVETFDFNWGTGSRRDTAQAVALDVDGRILVAGSAEFDDPDYDFGWLRLDNSYVFADGFEWGDTALWSATTP